MSAPSGNWPPRDVLANRVCPGCEQRGADGCKRGCPVVMERRERRAVAAAESKARVAQSNGIDPIDAMRDRIRA